MLEIIRVFPWLESTIIKYTQKERKTTDRNKKGLMDSCCCIMCGLIWGRCNFLQRFLSKVDPMGNFFVKIKQKVQRSTEGYSTTSFFIFFGNN